LAKLTHRLGHIAAEVKDFVGGHGLTAGRLALARGLDLVFPPHSFNGKGGDGLQQAGMTVEAWNRIRFLDNEGCDMCARPFSSLHFGLGDLCQACEAKPFPFQRARAACLYNDASRQIVLGFKHGDRLDVRPMLVRWLERAGAEILTEADAVVPVPLHWTRLFRRRYNQAAELARPLARLSGVDYWPDVLRRVRMTKQQGRSAEARWDNVRTAFAVPKGAEKRIRDRHVVLIDDVFTTGATLRACAAKLMKAGAGKVDVLVLARAVPAVAEESPGITGFNL
jgi:ComF family protein